MNKRYLSINKETIIKRQKHIEHNMKLHDFIN